MNVQILVVSLRRDEIKQCCASQLSSYTPAVTCAVYSFWFRMETFSLPGDVTVTLDGAHNGYSIQLLLQALRLRLASPSPSSVESPALWVLFGAGAEKCVRDMLRELVHPVHGADQVFFTKSNHFKALGIRVHQLPFYYPSYSPFYCLIVVCMVSDPPQLVEMVSGEVGWESKLTLYRSMRVVEGGGPDGARKRGRREEEEDSVVAVFSQVLALAQAEQRWVAAS